MLGKTGFCTVFYHPNEPSEILSYLKENNVPVKPMPSLTFDYLLAYEDKRVGVERKESPDFVQSIMDGRLWEQLYSMSTFCPLSYLAIIGNISVALIERGFPRSAYLGALASATLKRSPEGFMGHVSVVVLDTSYDFMEFLRLVCRKLTEEDVRLPVKPVKKTELKSLQVQTLATLPGVGERYAQELIEAFGSIYGVVNADLSSLARVLGERRALKVYRFLRGEL
jgi:DNA excision repair protein ERCC-4